MPNYDKHTCLLVVDIQNDFADPKGALSVAGGEAVVAAANVEIEQASAAGALIVYTQDWHPPHTPHFEADGGIWPVHCVQESWGGAFHPELQVVGPAVRKGTSGQDGYSGFTMRDPVSGDTSATELEQLLRDGQIAKLVLVGLATDYCVLETARDARRLGFETSVLASAVGAVDLQAGDGERALAALRSTGVSML